MKHKITKLFQIGIDDIKNVYHPEESRRIYLTNLIAVIIGSATLPYILIFYVLNLKFLSILIIPIAVAFYSCVYINYLKYYTIARIFLITIACVAACFYAICLGFEAGVQNLFFAYVFIPFFIFQSKKMTIGAFVMIILFYTFLMIVLFTIDIKPFVTTSNTASKIVFPFANITVLGIMVLNYYYSNSIITNLFKNRINNEIEKLNKAQEELEKSNITQKIIEEKNRELKIAYEKLKKSKSIQENLAYKAALGTLSMGIHHEIRNPMNIVKLGCQAVKININNQDYIKRTCDTMIGAIDRLNAISTLMLQYGKEVAPDKENVDINNVIKSLINLSCNYFNKKNVKIVLNLCKIDKIYGNDHQVFQIIMNLVINSSEAMVPENGGKIEISTYNTKFFPLNKNKENKEIEGVAIKIKDNGPGIPQENLKRILDPFFSTKTTHVGLGLSIVFNIVISHNGNIEINSKSGEGTEFIISLPKIKKHN